MKIETKKKKKVYKLGGYKYVSWEPDFRVMRKWKKWVIPALANRNMKCAMYLNLVATFQMLNSHMWIVSLRDNSETENINIPIYHEHKNGSWKPVTNVRSGDKVA